LPEKVLSFDGNKVKFVSSDIGPIVEKTTCATELKQIMLAADYLAKRPPPLIQNRYIIRTASVVNWLNNKVLVTKFCEGDNCEHLMRDDNNVLRRCSLELIREILLAMRIGGFMWGDLCPRNIIVSNKESIIWLVDFERKLILSDQPINKLNFSRFVRSYAWEEFNSFLFREEQSSFFSDILVDEINPEELVAVNSIISRRKRALLKQLFGSKDSYTMSEILTMQTLMADIATPFRIKCTPFFPMEIIDPWSCKFGGAQTYVELVLRLEKESEEGRYGILDKLSKSI